MFGKNFFITAVAGIASIALPAYAQSEDSGKNEVAVQAFGSFVKSTTDNGTQNSATNSGGVLGSYRRFFDAHNGVEVNYGYALNTQNYQSSSGAVGVKSYSHEVSGAYVFRLPLTHFAPFALAGAGSVWCSIRKTSRALIRRRAPRASTAAGADFNVSHHVFVRAEYRGFVYNSPTYNLTGADGADRITHRAEPSIGFGYRF